MRIVSCERGVVIGTKPKVLWRGMFSASHCNKRRAKKPLNALHALFGARDGPLYFKGVFHL